MTKKNKLSRLEQPTGSAGAQGSPAGTPTVLPTKVLAAASSTGVTTGFNAVGALPETAQATPEVPAAATAREVKQNVVATPPRTSGAGWFIPPQGPSGFRVKKD